MRAAEPVTAGYVERDGVKLYWEQFGDGQPTILLLPTWSIAHSRHWKFQVPYLARHHRVITFDGRAAADRTGPRSRPRTATWSSPPTRSPCSMPRRPTGRCSPDSPWARCGRYRSPSMSRDVCSAWSVSARPSRWRPCRPTASVYPFNERLASTEGWAKYNRYYWMEGGYADFLEFFFGRFFPEPHSTKQIEDFVGWGLEIDPATLVATDEGFVPAGRGRVSRRLRAGLGPRAGHPRRQGRDVAPRRRTSAGRAHRRATRHHRRWRSRCAGARSGGRQPRHQAVRRQDRPMRAR